MKAQIEGLQQFEGFALDAEKKILWCAGEIVQLPPKAVELLAVLIANKGNVVGKDELLQRVWGETFVEESVLSNNIYLLRKSLGELGAGKNLIQTVPRRGYRFNGEINADGAEMVIEHHVFEQISVESETDEKNAADEKPKNVELIGGGRRSRFRLPLLIAAVAIVLSLAGIFAFRQSRMIEKTGVPPTEIKSIAVLPLKTFAPGESDVLGLQIADALVTNLSGSRRIAVRPTGSIARFSATTESATEIGKKLETDAVLEGRIYKEADRIRVTLQLIAVKTGEPFWAGQFDGKSNEILRLQDSIVNDLAKLSFLKNENARRPTENGEAYENYLTARYFWQKRGEDDLRKAIFYFEKALQFDENFTEARVGLADAQFALFDFGYDSAPENVRLAKDNLLRAVAQNAQSSDALTTLGYVQSGFDRNWREAETAFKKAVETMPTLANAHHRYGVLLAKLRRFDEAENELRSARALDPTSPIINANLGVALYFAKRYDEAIEQFRRAIELDEKTLAARWRLARCLWQTGEREKSLAEFVNTFQIIGDPESAELVENGFRSGAPPEEIVSKLSQNWQKRLDNNKINASDIAVLSAMRRDEKETLRWSERAVAEKHPWATWFNAEPEFDFLRDNERFQAILRQMNFPE